MVIYTNEEASTVRIHECRNCLGDHMLELLVHFTSTHVVSQSGFKLYQLAFPLEDHFVDGIDLSRCLGWFDALQDLGKQNF